VIELTESGLIELDSARPTLEALRALGVRIAIDDFGTGYSALSYLARLPIDIVKIDRTFVSAVEAGGVEEAITTAIVALARRIGLVTVAEGIESVEESERVRALGCDYGQGYFIARPMPAEQMWSGESPTA
jgi:EAL domain-containing protein (putative c-di-GMP-specific phosphodiesterase class I)